ncbi:hypothetical protein BEWA_001240 [Theileria equi strain WA]|uniref:Uncharacterized protein n=1 Tax=Theileria equi strain WA TaxID=1537102 RepID=L0AYP8_THEEQ|nr:hypothetical protein BEWA_001240 [Theileria equi strain WA]AFZ80717.1 hypothetical protein BEWA_001240 [Theileria equi strain WA]|eukprot:XP_004830383.1 hypothetical protein BEWA_001240 [Theileria equi strain WA]
MKILANLLNIVRVYFGYETPMEKIPVEVDIKRIDPNKFLVEDLHMNGFHFKKYSIGESENLCTVLDDGYEVWYSDQTDSSVTSFIVRDDLEMIILLTSKDVICMRKSNFCWKRLENEGLNFRINAESLAKVVNKERPNFRRTRGFRLSNSKFMDDEMSCFTNGFSFPTLTFCLSILYQTLF